MCKQCVLIPRAARKPAAIAKYAMRVIGHDGKVKWERSGVPYGELASVTGELLRDYPGGSVQTARELE